MSEESVLIAADAPTALALGAALARPRHYCLQVDRLIESARLSDAACVLLDVRLGGQRWRAIEWAPLLLSLPLQPVVVAVGRRDAKRELGEARRWGCADYVNLSETAWAAALSRAVDLALALRRRDLREGRRPLPSSEVH